MRRRPPRSTRTDTLVPYTTLFRSPVYGLCFVPNTYSGWSDVMVPAKTRANATSTSESGESNNSADSPLASARVRARARSAGLSSEARTDIILETNNTTGALEEVSHVAIAFHTVPISLQIFKK